MQKQQLKLNFIPFGSEQAFLEMSGRLIHGTDSAGKVRMVLHALIDNDYSRIVLDLGGLTEIDAAGVETIVEAAAAAKNALATKFEIWRMPSWTCSLLALQVKLLTLADTSDMAP